MQDVAIQKRTLLSSRDMQYAPGWLSITQPCHVTVLYACICNFIATCEHSVFSCESFCHLVGELAQSSVALLHLLPEQLIVAAWQDLAKLSA